MCKQLFQTFFLLNLYKIHAKSTGNMHSVADRYRPSQNKIVQLRYAFLCIVHTFRPSSRCFLLYYFLLLILVSSPPNDFQTCILNTIFPYRYIYTLSFYKCLRTTYYNAILSYPDVGNVNVSVAMSYETSAVKCNSSCGILITRAICHNCSELVVQRQNLLESIFGVCGRTLF